MPTLTKDYSTSAVVLQAADPLAYARPHWIIELFLHSGVRRVSDQDVEVLPAGSPTAGGHGYGDGGYGDDGYGG